MGKWKERRKFAFRYNPSGSNSNRSSTQDNGGQVEPVLMNSSGQSVSGGLKSVEENISSALVEERIFGLNSLASMSLEEGAPEAIAKSSILSSVVPMLKDGSIQVRLGAVGALRNICVGGSDAVVEMVVKLDVIEPLSELLLQCNNNCQSPVILTSTKVPDEEVLQNPDICWNQILINTMSLMWNLCECCELAVDVFNKKDLIQVVISHIEPRWGAAVSLACADCLLCVSEDNDGLEAMRDKLSSLVKKLILECDKLPQNYRYIITLTGILVNLTQSLDNDTRIVLQTVAHVLDYSDYGVPVSNASAEQLTEVLASQQLALEILSNCCYNNESDDDSNNSEENWENVLDEGEEEADGEMMECSNNVSYNCTMSLEIEQCVKDYELVVKSLSKIGSFTPELEQSLNKHENKDLVNKFKTLRIRALICLQNLVGCLDMEILGGEAFLNNVWISLGQLIVSADKSDNELFESATGALRAVMEKLCNAQCVEQISKITTSDLKLLCELGIKCSVPNVRANLARTTGSIACLLVKVQSAEEIANEDSSVGCLLSGITYFLLKVADEDSELWVCAEALDVIIDIFSEDKTDKLAYHTGLTERIKGIKTIFLNKCRQKGKNFGDHNALISTVKDNLQAFIKYKHARVVKIGKKKSMK